MGNIGGMEQGKSQYEQQHDIYLSYGKRIAELEAKKAKMEDIQLRSSSDDSSMSFDLYQLNREIKLNKAIQETYPRDPNGCNYVVTHGGTVVCNEAIVRGDVYARNGVFIGKVIAAEGEFHGSIYSEDAHIRGTVYASAGEFNGKITSNHEGDRLVIDPADRSMKMINAANQEVVKQDFFVNNNYSGGQIQINLVDQTTGANHCHAVIDGGKIAVYRDGIEFARFDAYQKKIWIDADALPQGRDNAYAKEVYMDGETMKIRRE